MAGTSTTQSGSGGGSNSPSPRPARLRAILLCSSAFVTQALATPALAECTTDTTTLPGTTTVTCSGMITSVLASETDNNVVIDSTATVTQSDPATGIAGASTNGDVSISSSGDVTMFSDNIYGIHASSNFGDVSIASSGNVSTFGESSAGIVGATDFGSVAINLTGNVTTNGANSAGVSATVWKDGAIDIVSSGDITTFGAGSSGIYAYAVNGEANISSSGNIKTIGHDAFGLFVQSAEDASVVSTGNVSTWGNSAIAISAIGDDGDVSVESSGTVRTIGASAIGIYAYTVGGDASITVSGSVSTYSADSDGVLAVVDDEGDAVVNSTADVSTQGESSDGIDAYAYVGLASIVSKGNIFTRGNDAYGVIAGADFGEATIELAGSVFTTGDSAHGAYASVDFEGDASITSTAFVRTNGVDSNGLHAFAYAGDASITASGAIMTHGAVAYGLIAETIYGDASINVSGDVFTGGDEAIGVIATTDSEGSATITSTANVTTQGELSYALYAEVLGCGCGDAYLSSSGEVSTLGGGSHGLFATSNADSVIDASGRVMTSGEGAFGIFAYSGAYGIAQVNSTADVTTFGDQAIAITAVSVDDEASVSSSGTVTTFGNDTAGITTFSQFGDSKITNTGDVTVHGEGSAGLAAAAGFDLGDVLYGADSDLARLAALSGISGAAIVNSSGSVTVTGDESIGILAGSLDGAASITNSGDVYTSGDDSVAVSAFGVDVTIANSGSIYSESGPAIAAEGYVATVDNTGLVRGSVYLFATDAAFNNNAGGIFEIQSINLNGGTLRNAGVLSPGGLGDENGAEIVGNFVQTAGGVFLVDANWTSGTADRLESSTGGTASLAGHVAVNPLGITLASGLTQSFTIVDMGAGGLVENNGIQAIDSALIDYSLIFVGDHRLDLQAKINFLGTSGTLSGNQQSVGGALNSIAGGGGLDFATALIALSSEQQLGEALDQLAPLGDAGLNASAIATGSGFASQMRSCRVAGDEGEANAFIREGQCLWARASARRSDSDGGKDAPGTEESATFYSAGAQIDLGGPWRLGAAIGLENIDLATANRAKTDGERLHLGAIVKYNPGPLLLTAGFTGGWGWFDNERRVSFAGFDAEATSESDTGFLASRVSAAYLLSFGSWYLKPEVEAAVTYLERDGYRETGSGGIALDVEESDDTVVSVSPMLELGAQFRIQGGGIARPYVKAGVTWQDADEFTTTASFADVAGSSTPFSVSTEVDDIMADVGAGVDFIGPSGTVLRLQYDGRFGELTTQNSGTVKLSVPF